MIWMSLQTPTHRASNGKENSLRPNAEKGLIYWEPPSLQRNYPPSSVLFDYPTPCGTFAFLSLLSIVRHTFIHERYYRVSRVAAYSHYQTCHGLQPRGNAYLLAIIANTHIDFRLVNNVVFPVYLLTRLNPFNHKAYGLSVRCPTLKVRDYSLPSKDSLPSGRPAFRGGIRRITRRRLAEGYIRKLSCAVYCGGSRLCHNDCYQCA